MTPTLRLLLPALLAPTLLAAQTARYAVTVQPEQDVFRVRAEFAVPAGRDTFLVSLPAWTAGSYGIENYARFIRTFTVRAADGRALAWDKLDKDTWRIATAGATAVTIELTTNPDSLDLTMSAINDDFAFFNGTNFFLYPEGVSLDFAAELAVETPSGWRMATGLDATGPGRYRAASYHDLVDAPFFLGRLWMDSVVVDGRPIRFVAYPESVMTRPVWDSIAHALRGIVRVQNQLMGGPPYRHYTVLFYAPFEDMEWGGGLEHVNSQFDAIPAGMFAMRGSGRLGGFTASLLSHEFMHLWNVKRIRPAELMPYDYSREQYTPLLWWSEGVTDYYGDVTLARAGIWSVDRFLNSMSSNAMTVEEAREIVAVEDASINTWIDPTWVNESQLYYPKGALLGLMLDIQIREATGNRQSLDDVIRRLFTEYAQQNRGFTTQDLLGVIRPWFPGVDDFYARYINGREPLPYSAVLRRGGIAVTERTLTLKEGRTRRVIGLARDPGAPAQAAAILRGITGSR
jgi:predicted metalloprotease with PDZ domain